MKEGPAKVGIATAAANAKKGKKPGLPLDVGMLHPSFRNLFDFHLNSKVDLRFLGRTFLKHVLNSGARWHIASPTSSHFSLVAHMHRI